MTLPPLALVRVFVASAFGAAGVFAADANRTERAPNIPTWQVPPGWTTTSGGGSGREIVVTTLAPEGPGSLGAALAATGPRVIVFKIGGAIDLNGHIYTIRNPQVTIAAETAPGSGITLVRGGINIATHDVIIRHLRVRPGSAGRAPKSGWEVDALSTVGGAHDVIIDHCSFTWATDENLSASGPRFGGTTPDEWREHTSHRITFSHCIVAEALSNSTHGKGWHSMGSLIHDNVTDIAIVGNLYLSNGARNPLFKGGARGVIVNNVIHNPGGNTITYGLVPEEWGDHAWQDGAMAIVGNVMRQGPSTPVNICFLLMVGTGRCAVQLDDNLMLDRAGQTQPITLRYRESWAANAPVAPGGGPGFDAHATPPLWPANLHARPVADTLDWVLANAGAQPWNRDAVDRRLIEEARTGRGKMIDDQAEVGGYPALSVPDSRK